MGIGGVICDVIQIQMHINDRPYLPLRLDLTTSKSLEKS
jgi:hypothetical protein